MKKLSLAAIWAVLVAAIMALAVACSGSDAPAAFDPGNDGGKSTAAKDAGTKQNPPPRPIDETPDATPADDAPVPQVTSIAPTKAVLNAVGPTVSVSGALFVPRSKVLLDGVELATSYESDSELKATIPDDKLTAVAQLKISVRTAAPGGGTSSEVIFAVENPKPELTALNPLSVPTLSGTTTLTLTGKSFAPGAKVRFGDSDIPSTFKTDTSIEATIPSGLLTVSATKAVKVTNPLPGGGVSNELSFAVSNPNVNISSISPATTLINSSGFTITVKGSGFVSSTVIQFNGVAIPTTIAASDQLQGIVPATALTIAADIPITVLTPAGGGSPQSVSAEKTFTVNYPLPTVSSSNPSSVAAGSNATDVTITGTKFFPGPTPETPATRILINGTLASTTFVDATHLKTTLTQAQLAMAGTIEVKVSNPTTGGGGGVSSPLSGGIKVTNGTPKVNVLEPAAVESGAPDTVVVVRGTGFVTTTTAKSGATSLNVEYVDSATLKVTFPASLLSAAAGKTVPVILSNPPPGGGESAVTAASRLQILCNTAGVNAFIGDTSVTSTLQPNWATAPKLSRFVAGTSSCPTDVVGADKQPARYVVVQNNSTNEVLLQAWGDCEGQNGKGDGFIAVYRGTPPVQPTDDDARKVCVGKISEGDSLKSPDAFGSDKCPGLTKANGGATPGTLKLAACERAIVHIQAFKDDDPNTVPPVNLRVKGDTP